MSPTRRFDAYRTIHIPSVRALVRACVDDVQIDDLDGHSYTSGNHESFT